MGTKFGKEDDRDIIARIEAAEKEERDEIANLKKEEYIKNLMNKINEKKYEQYTYQKKSIEKEIAEDRITDADFAAAAKESFNAALKEVQQNLLYDANLVGSYTLKPVQVDDPDSFLNDPQPLIHSINYKYAEKEIIDSFQAYIDKTYKQHYKTANTLECFDAWIALGDSSSTFRDTAIKYLWRYGKKGGNNKDDLMKALHYVLLMMYVNHYMEKK
jgi:Protein of unknwon function (DUF3310)